MAVKGIDIKEVSAAIEQANVSKPVGTFFGKEKEFTISADGVLIPAVRYDPLIIKNDNGSITRFCDIGTAIDSVQNDKICAHYHEQGLSTPSVVLAVRKQPGANTLTITHAIEALLPSLEEALPRSIQVVKVFDQSDFILDSVLDVQFTLALALLLVILVIFLYLGTGRDTIIPVLTIPLAILGTLIVMGTLGFTIDILSILAITLSIGYLVDDAIVVVENIIHAIEKRGRVLLTQRLKALKRLA
jgi:HAE1 family hydrophobic/amphiphilic exporter-1